MVKTTEFEIKESDLTVDTVGLQKLTHSGRKTAVEIGMAAGAKINVGKRVLWNVKKVRTYLDNVSE